MEGQKRRGKFMLHIICVRQLTAFQTDSIQHSELAAKKDKEHFLAVFKWTKIKQSTQKWLSSDKDWSYIKGFIKFNQISWKIQEKVIGTHFFYTHHLYYKHSGKFTNTYASSHSKPIFLFTFFQRTILLQLVQLLAV